ncbi:MAG: hypothetical protein ABL914_03060 [Novosphingobium sp.]|uniref:hypothetical protein n=1 Tax=Novosphingobium sp. TaxID=1874826 RepID=UPI0032BC8258
MDRDTAAPHDRFSQWRRLPARLLLAVLLLVLIASAMVPIAAGLQQANTAGFAEAVAGDSPAKAQQNRPRDEDLALYDRVIARIGQGENYYAVAAEEHRKAHYPLRPGVAVRLPTLAYIDTWLGDTGKGADLLVPGELAAALALMLAVIWAWWNRLGDEPGTAEVRRIGAALIFVGASLGLNRYYFVLHELWAGMLIALALALHRPGRKWLGAVMAAGLALAIREHALPFVLLMGALALYRREWKEAAAWTALVLAFAAGLAWHLQQVAMLVQPGDPIGPSWLELRGLSGWLSNVVLSSNLRFLPHYLAGPVVVLMMVGWAGWKSPLGTTAALLFFGYGAAFMIAGRPDNFYWGAVIAPGMFVGLAFVPMALKGLIGAARKADSPA